MYEISVKSFFASAHRLRGYEGVCENIHGHNWKVEAVIRLEELNQIGIGIDFKKLKNATDEIMSRLDHKDLNQMEPFQTLNPSSENLAKWIFDQLSAKLNTGHAKVHKITVWETDSFSASYMEKR